MISGVYMFRNIINGKVYVGRSKDLKNRRRTHLHALRHNQHGNKNLQNDFNDYGENNFVFEVWFECGENEFDSIEQKLISIFDLMNPLYGYNLDMGGMKGRKLSEEHKKKLSVAKLGVFVGEKSPSYGKEVSKTSRLKMSESHLGELHPCAKLTKQDVYEIKHLLKHRIYKQKEIAKIYGVGHTTIGYINTGKKWTKVKI